LRLARGLEGRERLGDPLVPRRSTADPAPLVARRTGLAVGRPLPEMTDVVADPDHAEEGNPLPYREQLRVPTLELEAESAGAAPLPPPRPRDRPPSRPRGGPRTAPSFPSDAPPCGRSPSRSWRWRRAARPPGCETTGGPPRWRAPRPRRPRACPSAASGWGARCAAPPPSPPTREAS